MNEEFEELYTPPEKKKKKSDPKLCILMLQFTACFLLATAAICIRFFGGAFYEEVRSCYIRMFEDDTSVTEVLSALSPKAENGNVSSVPGTGAPPSRRRRAVLPKTAKAGERPLPSRRVRPPRMPARKAAERVRRAAEKARPKKRLRGRRCRPPPRLPSSKTRCSASTG